MEQLSAILASSNENYIKTTKVEYNRHEVFLDDEIGEPSCYRELISLLFNASEADEFTFYINTIGGSLSTTLAIIEGMKNTNAVITGVLMNETHSGGSMIALNCHNLAVLDSAEMMCHTASYGTAGNVSNVRSHTEFATRRVAKIIDDTYEGFLTPEEIVELKKGVEMWFDAEEIRERMGKRVALLQSREEEGADESGEAEDEVHVAYEEEQPKKKRKKRKKA